MRILIIDNNLDKDCWGASDIKAYAAKTGHYVFVRRAPHDDLPQNISFYDRIVISGSRTSALDKSPWISNLDKAIREALNLGKAILGVCYGHQVLARVLNEAVGGRPILRKALKPEVGWIEIKKQAACGLFKDLSDSFYSFASHYDEVERLPTGAILTASSNCCPIQAFQVENSPVFGIQFHPERQLEQAEVSLKKKVAEGQKGLLRPGEGHKLYNQEVGESIFKNFFSYD